MAKNRSRPRNLGLVLLLVCVAAGNAASAWAQERLSNRFFEADLSGWTVSPGGSASWSGDDRLGSLSSGSAILGRRENRRSDLVFRRRNVRAGRERGSEGQTKQRNQCLCHAGSSTDIIEHQRLA